MLPSSDIVEPVGAEHHTLDVAIEIGGKSWVIRIKGPASGRIGGAADVVGLKDLIEHQQTRVERNPPGWAACRIWQGSGRVNAWMWARIVSVHQG